MCGRLRGHRAVHESIVPDHVRDDVRPRPSTIVARTGSRSRTGNVNCNAARCMCRGFKRNLQLKRANLANHAACTGAVRAPTAPGDCNAGAHGMGERVGELRRRGGGGQRARPGDVHQHVGQRGEAVGTAEGSGWTCLEHNCGWRRDL
jgi:hypothetical protein